MKRSSKRLFRKKKKLRPVCRLCRLWAASRMHNAELYKNAQAICTDNSLPWLLLVIITKYAITAAGSCVHYPILRTFWNRCPFISRISHNRSECNDKNHLKCMRAHMPKETWSCELFRHLRIGFCFWHRTIFGSRKIEETNSLIIITFEKHLFEFLCSPTKYIDFLHRRT